MLTNFRSNVNFQDVRKTSSVEITHYEFRTCRIQVIMSVPAYTESKNFYFTAEIILGVTIFVVILGNFYLLSSGKTTSDGIIAIGSAAVGALAGLFSASK
jgi:hypothetical protein